MPEQTRATSSGRALWSGTLSFGLVTVPVDLLPALRGVRSSLRMLSSEGHGLAQQYIDGRGKVVDSSEIERGYPVAKDRFVVLKDQELEGLAPEKSQDLNVVRFVDARAISPMFFAHPYLLAPRGSRRAYQLLARTMEELDKVALASFVMRDTEYVVAVRSVGGVLRADVIRFVDELREGAKVPGVQQERAPTPAKARAMKKTLGSLKRKPFTGNLVQDPYWERVEKLAQQKARGHRDVVQVEEPSAQEPGAEVIDLMEVLKRSLGATKPKGSARARGRGGRRTAHGRS